MRLKPVALLILAFLAGCRLSSTPTSAASTTSSTTGAPVSASTPASAPASITTSSSPPAPTGSPTAPAVSAGLVLAVGDGWTSAGLEGEVPGPGNCHYRTAADGYPLPDPACTPGAVDSRVTQADLDSTICRSGGYTGSVRPPESMTERFKYQSEAAYRDPASTSDTELDHLVPLELGGASDTPNLWPEPDQGQPSQFDPQDPFGQNAKDGVEDRLHDAVCAGQVSLVEAQEAIALDWTTALSRLGVAP